MSRKARNRPGRTKTVLGVVGFVIALFSYLMLQQDTEVEPVAGLRQNYDGYSNYSLPLHFAYKKYNTTKVLCGAECTSTDSCNAFTYKMNASVSCRLYRQPPTVWGYQASEDPTADVFFKKYLFGRAKRTLNGRYYYIGQKLMTVKEAANHCETLPGGIFQLSVNSEETERLGLYKIMYTVQKLTIKDGHLDQTPFKLFIKTVAQPSQIPKTIASEIEKYDLLWKTNLVKLYLTHNETIAATDLKSPEMGYPVCEADPLNININLRLAVNKFPDFDVDLDIRDIVYE